MHVAFITSEYPHSKVKNAAGIGTSIKNLAEALVNLGVEISIFIYGQEENDVFNENGISYHLISDKSYAFGKWYFYRKLLNKYINRFVEAEKITVIEAADWTGITAFMKFKVPSIIRFHGSDTYFCHIEQRKQKWKNFYFEKCAVKNADALITPTKFAGDLSRKLFNVSEKKYSTIHHGLNLENFYNSDPDNLQKGTLLYIGSLVRKKGVLEIPKIFRFLREKVASAKLILIGSDCPDIESGGESTWQVMQKLFTSEEIKNVIYLGQIPYNNVKEHIMSANVCIFPTFAETFGMVTIEAMALQKAVVNSNIGWANELMEDGKSGYLVDPKDHRLYAERIADILEDDSVAFMLGKNAEEFVLAKFDIKNIAKENLSFYQQISTQ